MTDRPIRRLAAIVAADVADYSRLVGLDEEATLSALKSARRDVIDPLIREHSGRIANTAGDSLLIEFSSVVDAVRCAHAIQSGLTEWSADTPPDRRLAFRIGVNVGDVVSEGADLLGDGVNIAARIESVAEVGGIALSDDAYRYVRDRLDIAWRDFGEHRLKNIARPVRIWAWAPGTSATVDAIGQAAGSSLLGASKPSIAVLPFDNRSDDPEQGYFADGITEDIITEIARLPELLVIARNSTFTYKNKAAKIQDVCRDLNVRYVVEGSIRKSGERVRINAQLIDGSSGGHLWAERYDRTLTDIFAVQDDVVAKIVRALKIKLITPKDPPPQRSEPHTPDAYDCVLRAREQYRLFTNESNLAAQALYERAITLDPSYAEPYAGLAETYVQQWLTGVAPTLDRALELAQAAVVRDASLPLVHEALSTVYLFMRRHDDAIGAARRWIELEPSNADAYATLAGAMHFAGRNEPVIELIETAMRLNPKYPFFYPHYIGLANLGMRRFAAAVAAFQRAAARNAEALWPHVYLAATYALANDGPKARSEAAEVLRINPEFSVTALPRLLPYKRSSDIDEIVAGLRETGLAD